MGIWIRTKEATHANAVDLMGWMMLAYSDSRNYKEKSL
jgi:hypothetical protein